MRTTIRLCSFSSDLFSYRVLRKQQWASPNKAQARLFLLFACYHPTILVNMPTPLAQSTPSASRSRTTPKPSVAPPTTGRVTRLRAAKDVSASPGIGKPSSGPSLLARGKEGLRNVSNKMREKEKAKEVEKAKTVDGGQYSESLQAFLRIRPPPPDDLPEGSRPKPYLEPQGDRDVLMRAPFDPSRPQTAKPPHLYSFDRVFPPTTPQSTFFTTTTLPLVEKLLHGENGLLFAYGVSNSGKSYTISGGNESTEADRGLLPRAVDVIFNSVQGLESQANLRCVGLADVEVSNEREQSTGLLDGLSGQREASTIESVKVDRNHSYAVFVSYSEVYNEKIFDLLDSVLPTSILHSAPQPKVRVGQLSRSSSHHGLSGAFNSSMNLAAMANGGAGVLKRRALALKNDPEGNGKYVAGLNEVRVRTREEALAVFRSGQRARQVFGTLANRESSRSHGIFTIKVVRIHNGAPEDPDSAQVSRLAIVDLAGSERTRNTGTTGDRLREAGNINKSLMVLGQCLEVLRSNQQKMAAPTPAGSKKRLAVVPFRHSKLTEIFQNFFVGDGRAVMIVNVNPYDTGFDENAHVMRFSAVAREIQTTAQNKVGFPGNALRRQISTQFSALKHAVSGPNKIKVVVPVLPKIEEGQTSSTAVKGKIGIDRERESQGFILVEEEIEVVEESDDSGSEDERDVMVEHLFEQLAELRTRLYESEMRNATVEVDVREEVSREMAETMQKMHAEFNQRLQDQVAAGELKTDRKLDILSRTIATPAAPRTTHLSNDTPATEAELDTSVDESFEAAIDESLAVMDESIDVGRMSDVFLVQPLQAKKAISPDEDSEDEILVGEHSVDAIGIEAPVHAAPQSKTVPAVEHRSKREDTVESDSEASTELESASELSEDEDDELESEDEDILAVPPHDPNAGDNSEDSTFDEDAEDDEEALSASSSESPESDSESEFEGATEPEPSSAEPSPVRGASAKRRTTGGARGRTATASPTKIRTPARGKVQVKEKGKVKVKVISEESKVKSPSGKVVLGESKSQDILSDSDESETVEAIKVVKKGKKRTLTKKVIDEDEMERQDGTVGGTEVRRMVRASGL
ncbi:P-loop containing nucleoside triphosphate hydrolase protein [Naematelia encephala]|uniref:p-loop containing nucleoside triphosphate hydrolase protein n=1 Tax=Naematelia encephala TaxID=71784 RepID=A0A1Y2BMH9_9TREE|nr:P-loop containing nucleoside triphosphate hydrolase protein [Naematelia encephala]